MEIKNWSYDEFPEFDEEVPGVKRISTSGDEIGTMVLPNVQYANVDGNKLHMQIIVPISRNTREIQVQLPCVVFVQGSAWLQQNVFQNIGMLARLAEEGYVVAIVEYRHSGIASFPAQAEDARNAVRFMKKYAAEYGVDADNIFLAGDSSGGHTAVFAGIIRDDESKSNQYPSVKAEVRGIIDLYGSVSVMLEDGNPTTENHHMPDSPEGMVMGGVNLSERSDLRKALSAECNIDEKTELAPMLIFHGTKDRIVNTRQSIILYQHLKKLGKDVELYLVEGGDHGGPEYWTPNCLKIMDEFIQKWKR